MKIFDCVVFQRFVAVLWITTYLLNCQRIITVPSVPAIAHAPVVVPVVVEETLPTVEESSVMVKSGEMTNEVVEKYYSGGRKSELDFNSIGLRLTDSQRFGGDVYLRQYTTGLQHREGKVHFNRLYIKDIVVDGINSWNGGLTIEELYIEDTYPFEYSDRFHKDLVQAYVMDTKTYARGGRAYEGLTINKMWAKVRGKDKAIIQLTENVPYRNIHLWKNGVTIDSDSNSPYLLNATNLQDSVLGSPEHPIDAAKVSGKIIRIKPKQSVDGLPVPQSRNTSIHATFTLTIIAPPSVTIIRYPPTKTP